MPRRSCSCSPSSSLSSSVSRASLAGRTAPSKPAAESSCAGPGLRDRRGPVAAIGGTVGDAHSAARSSGASGKGSAHRSGEFPVRANPAVHRALVRGRRFRLLQLRRGQGQLFGAGRGVRVAVENTQRMPRGHGDASAGGGRGWGRAGVAVSSQAIVGFLSLGGETESRPARGNEGVLPPPADHVALLSAAAKRIGAALSEGTRRCCRQRDGRQQWGGSGWLGCRRRVCSGVISNVFAEHSSGQQRDSSRHVRWRGTHRLGVVVVSRRTAWRQRTGTDKPKPHLVSTCSAADSTHPPRTSDEPHPVGGSDGTGRPA